MWDPGSPYRDQTRRVTAMNPANFLYWLAAAGVVLLVVAVIGMWLGERLARRGHDSDRSTVGATPYLRWETDEMPSPQLALRAMAAPQPELPFFRKVS